ncbi:dynamin-related protein 3B-like [Chenopodium quinoa]|uniref:dynamin-related protein 3B-like n=1 Tax=Chenopodium quinoa TaxID=63459 RepID=UPI000B76DA36|nr:dynamin-related protein 3B-like [Chenopodium quinoa]XP_021728217.1 dynamin-related protein 3B-like [Chenopodium quinoa]
MAEEDEQPQSPPQKASSLGQTLIPVVNKLQDICSQSGVSIPINLPQVAVVGSQSSGKSSVIEALVGRDFLPRGPDVVTRRPLMLHLIQTKVNNGGGDGGGEVEYGEFLHFPGRKFYDFSEIRNEIQAETEREAGGNRGISEKTISLKIYSPNVLDITLIDLPGITRVPVGDQPSDIEARIRTMIMKYIRHPSCLILAVTPANSDLANSDALQIAGNADPDGKRTIGVITKLDIMDRGTDARNLLLGKVIPLQLGYVGVVNRSQEDIMRNRSIKDALAAEERFFRSHPEYVNLADRCGVPQLAKKLNQILVQHIRECLPALKSAISSQLVTVTKEYASYGETPDTRAGQGTLLLNILSKYSEAFSSLVEGKSEEISTSELSGGARIHYIFQCIFVKSLEDVDPCDGLPDEDIRTAIHNARGPRSAVFAAEVPFEVLVRRQIGRLSDPSIQCAQFIYNELVKMSHSSMVNELQRYPVLRKRVDEVVGRFLRENLNPAESIIRHLIEMEMDYINTSHPNFIGGSRALEMAHQQIRSSMVVVPVSRQRDTGESDTTQGSERSSRSRAIVRSPANGFIKPPANGVISDQGVRANTEADRNRPTGSSIWGISSIFSGTENQPSTREAPKSIAQREPAYNIDHAPSTIQLREPPTILRSSETLSEQEATEIAATKLLLSSYFDIVRKIIEDSVPKAIMHFLVNHTKRELHNVLIQKLYREKLFEEMLQEPGEVSAKRKHARETLRVLQQAFQTLDELPLEAETIERGYSLGTDSIGLPRTHGLPPTSSYNMNIY